MWLRRIQCSSGNPSFKIPCWNIPISCYSWINVTSSKLNLRPGSSSEIISYLMVTGQMTLRARQIVRSDFALARSRLLLTSDPDLRKKFAAIQKEHSLELRPFYCHFTSVIDTQSTKLILMNGKPSWLTYAPGTGFIFSHPVQDMILRANLKKSSLMAWIELALLPVTRVSQRFHNRYSRRLATSIFNLPQSLFHDTSRSLCSHPCIVHHTTISVHLPVTNDCRTFDVLSATVALQTR
jgi:hypothetical protein